MKGIQKKLKPIEIQDPRYQIIRLSRDFAFEQRESIPVYSQSPEPPAPRNRGSGETLRRLGKTRQNQKITVTGCMSLDKLHLYPRSRLHEPLNFKCDRSHHIFIAYLMDSPNRYRTKTQCPENTVGQTRQQQKTD